MLINLLWDEPKAGSFAVITTTNITFQDIEKNKRLNIEGFVKVSSTPSVTIQGCFKTPLE